MHMYVPKKQKLFMATNMSVAFYVLILVCCSVASVSVSSTSQAVSCPGDVLTIECAITNVGITVALLMKAKPSQLEPILKVKIIMPQKVKLILNETACALSSR